LPALVSPVVGLGVVALTGQSLNLFHLFAALVVMSMAMDYGIFVVETAKDDARPEEVGATLSSIVIAALTTSLSFGLLGFSSLPVLQGIGQTTAAGIAVALLLTPVSLWLLRGTGQRSLHNARDVQ
jgi:predicted exporter